MSLAASSSFGKNKRLLRNEEYRRIYRIGKRLSSPSLTLVYRLVEAGDKLKPAKLGLSVSRKVGKANQRNLIKRRLRQIFRLHQLEIFENAELVIIPRKEALEFDYFGLEIGVLKLISRAKLLKEVKN